MSFKFYKNKKNNHPAISIRQNHNNFWYNMPLTHEKIHNDSYFEIKDPHPKNTKRNKRSYIRKYVRVDKRGVKGHPYREYVLSKKDEIKIKLYLKNKYKKR